MDFCVVGLCISIIHSGIQSNSGIYTVGYFLILNRITAFYFPPLISFDISLIELYTSTCDII